MPDIVLINNSFRFFDNIFQQISETAIDPRENLENGGLVTGACIRPSDRHQHLH